MKKRQAKKNNQKQMLLKEKRFLRLYNGSEKNTSYRFGKRWRAIDRVRGVQLTKLTFRTVARLGGINC